MEGALRSEHDVYGWPRVGVKPEPKLVQIAVGADGTVVALDEAGVVWTWGDEIEMWIAYPPDRAKAAPST